MKKFILFTFYFIINYGSAQKFDLGSLEVKSDTDLLKTTVYLEAQPPNSPIGYKGTGFFYYDNRNQNVYLITNKHVIGDYKSLAFTVKNRGQSLKDNFSIYTIPDIGDLCIFPENTIDRDSDLVLINLTKAGFKVDDYNFKVFTKKNIPDNKYENFLFTNNVFDIGYPALVSQNPTIVPYLVQCSLATPYNLDYFGSKEFCINGNVVSGFSGSPVVYINHMNQNKTYLLLGIDCQGLRQFKEVGLLSINPNNHLQDIKLDSLSKGVMHEIFINICLKSELIIKTLNQ